MRAKRAIPKFLSFAEFLSLPFSVPSGLNEEWRGTPRSAVNSKQKANSGLRTCLGDAYLLPFIASAVNWQGSVIFCFLKRTQKLGRFRGQWLNVAPKGGMVQGWEQARRWGWPVLLCPWQLPQGPLCKVGRIILSDGLRVKCKHSLLK